jgi:hypothetical protein
MTRIDDWWSTFAKNKERIAALFERESNWNLPDWMAAHLGPIHPKLMWEYGPAVKCSGHRLVITPESARHLRPLTSTIIERAPQVSGWEFYGYRLAEELDWARGSVEGRTGATLDDVRVQAVCGKHHRIDLCYYFPALVGENDGQALDAAFVATESLLGEECLDKWIGAIEVDSLRSGSRKKTVELGELRANVDALIGSVCDQLPDRPYYEWAESTEWTLWRLTPEKATDYPEQLDLFVGTSCNRALWEAAHSGTPFCSQRFSRSQEIFCYVKLDGSEGLDQEKFADKSEIEDALDVVLKPARLGCQIGGGTGLRYSYIDLALTDVERGTKTLRDRLRQGNVPKRSWILFYDADLAGEWVGIYEDSPPPPLPDLNGTGGSN